LVVIPVENLLLLLFFPPFPRSRLPENPLLPNRKLQDLYALMQRSRALDLKHARKQIGRAQKPSRPVAREALLAATSIHLLPSDLLCAEPGDRTAEQLAPAPKSTTAAKSGLLATPDLSPRLLLCTAAARGLQAAASEGLVLAYANLRSPAASAAGWAAALEWAQSAQLPLLLACIDSHPANSARRSSLRSSGTAAKLDWASMNRLAHRLRLPVLPVDGEDAVAVYRAMQEAALRARMGGGPAVIWAVMSPVTQARPAPGSSPSSPSSVARKQQPLARLRSYLAARQIALPAR
jgi:hypothetical protein